MAVVERGLFLSEQSPAEIWELCLAECRRALVDRKHPFRYVNLATADASGIGLRMLVLRDLDDQAHLWLHTDHRTTKIQQLREDPRAAILCWHPRKKVQLRWEGEIQLHHQDAVSRDWWARLTPEAKKAYLALATPGQTVAEAVVGFPVEEAAHDRYFTVLEFVPERVEVLQLGREGHLRMQWEAPDWQGKWLAP